MFGRTNLRRDDTLYGAPRMPAKEGKRPRSRAVTRKPRRTEPDPIAARVGNRIRALRGETKFSFDAFVEETGLGRGYVSELERGLVVPTIGTLARVARALEVTIADLVSGDSERERLFEDLRGQPNTVIRDVRDHVRRIAAPLDRESSRRPR
jgi:transcriptional regulator with XRE-family HTH domain